MTWRVVAASEVGTSHLAAGKACEDSCFAQSELSAAATPVLSIFVADGAGTAAHGGEGAELAIEAAADFLTACLAEPRFSPTEALALGCVQAVRLCIDALAAQRDLVSRDFACTFLGLISTLDGAVVFQVGDGGLVVDVGQGLELAVVPMSGEYANETHFVTGPNALEALAIKRYDAGVVRAAAFTDGIQRLALNMAGATPHEPFFAPLYRVLETATDEQEDELNAAMTAFLASASVNERTDDDKTLALAVRKA